MADLSNDLGLDTCLEGVSALLDTVEFWLCAIAAIIPRNITTITFLQNIAVPHWWGELGKTQQCMPRERQLAIGRATWQALLSGCLTRPAPEPPIRPRG